MAEEVIIYIYNTFNGRKIIHWHSLIIRMSIFFVKHTS